MAEAVDGESVRAGVEAVQRDDWRLLPCLAAGSDTAQRPGRTVPEAAATPRDIRIAVAVES